MSDPQYPIATPDRGWLAQKFRDIAGQIEEATRGTRDVARLVGEFKAGSSIAAGTDLDAITTTGQYHQNAGANATLALHYPLAGQGGLLVVEVGTNFIAQRYRTRPGSQPGRVYERAKFGANAWSAWVDLSGAATAVVPTSMAVGSGSGSYDSFGKVTFAGASSVSLNGIFSGDYLNYLLLVNIDSTTSGGGLCIRFGVGTSDDASGYTIAYAEHPSTTAWSTSFTSTTEIRLGRVSSTGGVCRATIFSPFLAGARSYAEGTSYDSDQYHGLGSGRYATAKSHDRLTVYAAGVTATGTLEVYGLRG